MFCMPPLYPSQPQLSPQPLPSPQPKKEDSTLSDPTYFLDNDSPFPGSIRRSQINFDKGEVSVALDNIKALDGRTIVSNTSEEMRSIKTSLTATVDKFDEENRQDFQKMQIEANFQKTSAQQATITQLENDFNDFALMGAKLGAEWGLAAGLGIVACDVVAENIEGTVAQIAKRIIKTTVTTTVIGTSGGFVVGGAIAVGAALMTGAKDAH